MAKTVVGLFSDPSEAQRVVQEVTALGIPRNDISLVAHRGGNIEGEANRGDSGHDSYAGTGAGTGAVSGAVLGGAAGILASLGLIAIPGVGPLLAAGPIVATLTGAGVGAAVGGVAGALIGWGIPADEAEVYEEGVRRGNTMVAVKSPDDQVDAVSDILDRHHAIDVDTKSAEWRAAGWTPKHATSTSGSSATATSAAASAGRSAASTGLPTDRITSNQTSRSVSAAGSESTAERTTGSGQTQRIPVVEEHLAVGKRAVQRGGVRVYSHVTEWPVEENVTLHEEHVQVERHATNRPVNAGDAAFRDQTVEVTETAEEAVVGKTARVVEEVVVRKDAADREQTIRDSVRKTDVRVEKIAGEEAGRPGSTPARETDTDKV